MKITDNAILYWWLNLFQRVVSSRVRARANICIGAYVHLFCRLWIILGRCFCQNLNSIIVSKFIQSISEIHRFYFSVKFAGSQVVLDLNRCTLIILRRFFHWQLSLTAWRECLSYIISKIPLSVKQWKTHSTQTVYSYKHLKCIQMFNMTK